MRGGGLDLGVPGPTGCPVTAGAGDVTLFCDARQLSWKPTAEAGGEERPGLGLVCQPHWAAPLLI